jgi:putative glutamine amidotransferase
VKRPAVGITIGPDDRGTGLYALRQDYLRSVENGGGLPVVLAPGRPEDAPDLLDRVRGLLLSGGSDVDPSLYGAHPHAKLGRVVRERDDFELALCRGALERDLPILAICRGHQVLNVATGGTLVQDIPSELKEPLDHDPALQRWERTHEVDILQSTRLRAILGRERMAVNSSHHQAVESLGQGLTVSAVSREDEVIEGIEMPGRRFVVGVQWHPEAFWDRASDFLPLFQALAEASRS